MVHALPSPERGWKMLRTITITAELACTAMLTGCAADTTTFDQGPAPAAEQPITEPQAFTLRLDSATTAETVIPAIMAVGHDQIAMACEANPGASIRIFNPLAPGDYADVPCTAILGDNESTGGTGAALTSDIDGPIGQDRQKIGPISFLMCGLFAAGSTLALNYGVCPHARTPKDRKNCGHVSNFGGAAITILCAIPF